MPAGQGKRGEVRISEGSAAAPEKTKHVAASCCAGAVRCLLLAGHCYAQQHAAGVAHPAAGAFLSLCLQGWQEKLLCDGLHFTEAGNNAVLKQVVQAINTSFPEAA